RHLEKAADVARCGLADGDDFMLPPNEPTDATASIEHSPPIIFLRDMKRGEVVNGGDHSARLLPNHPAIAWNVQKVQTQTPGNGWKFGVMPKDIFYWRTEFFRNRHEPHVVAGEIEKREIIFQDEQRELVLVR